MANTLRDELIADLTIPDHWGDTINKIVSVEAKHEEGELHVSAKIDQTALAETVVDEMLDWLGVGGTPVGDRPVGYMGVYLIAPRSAYRTENLISMVAMDTRGEMHIVRSIPDDELFSFHLHDPDDAMVIVGKLEKLAEKYRAVSERLRASARR